MGNEVSTYINRVVAAMQAAYGTNWNITARGEDPVEDDRAWLVQVGFDDFDPRPTGNLGLTVVLKCRATVSYRGKGATHNSGLQASDITTTLGAWIAAYIDTVTRTTPENLEMDMEPPTRDHAGVLLNTGDWRGHFWWDVRLDFIDPDISVAGYVTGHPARPLGPYIDHGVDIDSIAVLLLDANRPVTVEVLSVTTAQGQRVLVLNGQYYLAIN